MKKLRGYTLIELIIATGLFALIMLLASGAYLMMIGLERQAQGIATGIDNLSFAIETMTRDIRTGTAYNCGVILISGDCALSGGTSFTFTPSGTAVGTSVTYALDTNTNTITKSDAVNGTVTLTDPSVSIESLKFYVVGTSNVDNVQPHVTITISGKVLYGHGQEKSETFHIETGATMRGSDI